MSDVPPWIKKPEPTIPCIDEEEEAFVDEETSTIDNTSRPKPEDLKET